MRVSPDSLPAWLMGIWLERLVQGDSSQHGCLNTSFTKNNISKLDLPVEYPNINLKESGKRDMQTPAISIHMGE